MTTVPRSLAIRRPTRTTVSAALRAMSRPAGSFDAARYFRGAHGLRFYNAGTAQVRAFARDIYLANRDDWTVEDATKFAGELMHDPYLETKGIGIEVVGRYRRSFTPRLLPEWRRWLSDDLSTNWATTDAICGMLIGPLLADHPERLEEMLGWARHRNMWVRRASAVALIPAMRRGLALDVAYDVARRLHADEEDLIQKAVGWMLREAGKQDSDRLERYLREHGPAIPRTTLRYAIERFPPAKRQALLAATRGASSSSSPSARASRSGRPAARRPRAASR